MTEIEQKALALLNTVRSKNHQPPLSDKRAAWLFSPSAWEAIKTAIEQHEQFKREVSSVCEHLPNRPFVLDRFILPKPDHIRGAALDIGVSWGPNDSKSFRAALAKRGLQISEVQHDAEM